MAGSRWERGHEWVPTDPEENVAWRAAFLGEVRRAGPAAAEGVRRLCGADVLFWVRAFVWQVNPNPLTPIADAGPFVPWGEQEKMLRWVLEKIDRRRDGVCEKSRDLGASWLFLLAFDWRARFRANQHFLVLSRDEDSVDDGTPDSIFGKLAYLAGHVPAWVSPAPAKRSLRWRYAATGSWVVGRASTGSAGVGGRATAILFDEYSRFGGGKKAAAGDALRATADVSRCRLFNSTHTEVDTAFHRLTQREDLSKFVLHWTHHEEKRRGLYSVDPETKAVEVLDKEFRGTVELEEGKFHRFPEEYPFVTDGRPFGGPFPGLRSPWYDAECLRRADSRAISMDLDIDVKGATRQFFDAQALQNRVVYDCKEPYWQGDAVIDHSEGELADLVPNETGPLSLWLTLDVKNRPPADRYAFGIDVAWGQGGTPSCLSIFSATTGQQVGEYANPWIEPAAFGALAVALARWFRSAEGGGAYLIWETSGPGASFRKKVLDLGYGHIYYRVDEKKVPPERSANPGWYSSPQTKAFLLSQFSAAVNSGACQIRSRACLEDCKSFKHDGRGGVEHPREKNVDDPSGAREGHADRGMSAALGWKGCQETGFKAEKKAEPRAADVTTLAGRVALAEAAAGGLAAEVWH